MGYIVKPIVSDYAVCRHDKIICICNFKSNAELIADILNAEYEDCCSYSYDSYPFAKYKIVKVESEEEPPVTPHPMSGHWINIEDRTDWLDAAYKCSCCGREIITPYEEKNNLYSDYPYCHCGAKMEGLREI